MLLGRVPVLARLEGRRGERGSERVRWWVATPGPNAAQQTKLSPPTLTALTHAELSTKRMYYNTTFSTFIYNINFNNNYQRKARSCLTSTT